MSTHVRSSIYVSVTQQNYMPISGVLAFAVSIYFGMDPENINYDSSKARDHLRKCLTSGHIEPRPGVIIISNCNYLLLNTIFKVIKCNCNHVFFQKHVM